MEDITTPREKILKKVRAALLNKFSYRYADADNESGVFPQGSENLAVSFAEKFTANGGGFVYSHNFFDFSESLITLMEKRNWKEIACQDRQLKKELVSLGLPVKDVSGDPNQMEVGITRCESLVSRTGAIVFSSRQDSPTLTFFPQTHIVMAKLSQVVRDMKESMLNLRNRYGDFIPGEVIFVHGPGRYLDGAANPRVAESGPIEIIVFLVNDTQPLHS